MSSQIPKIGVHFSHYECFGHTSRAIAVGEIFKKGFPDGGLFFIQAGVEQPKSKIDQLGCVYSLPEAFMDRRHFREPLQGVGVSADLRSKACENILSQENPDLLITEFFPLGREEFRFELIPSLIRASKQGIALWAIAGYPLLTGTDNDWREKILKLYQRIIIFSPSSEKDFIAESFTDIRQRQEYLDFFERHSSKITFTGYLLPQHQVVRDDEDANLPKPPVFKGACQVAILRGGGAYYPKLIAEAIRASDILGKEYYFRVVAGPSTTGEEWYFFSTLVSKKKVKNLVLYRSLGDYEGLIKKSDVCVSVAGYHTSVMLLKHQKKTVLIPFEGYGNMSFHEQQARAAMLKKIMGASILNYQDLTAQTLAESIGHAAASKEFEVEVSDEWFNGGDYLDKALNSFLGSKIIK